MHAQFCVIPEKSRKGAKSYRNRFLKDEEDSFGETDRPLFHREVFFRSGFAALQRVRIETKGYYNVRRNTMK